MPLAFQKTRLQHPLLLLLLVALAFGLVFILQPKPTQSRTLYWTQTSWTGGASSEYATQTGWTKYESADPLIQPGADLIMTNNLPTFTCTGTSHPSGWTVSSGSISGDHCVTGTFTVKGTVTVSNTLRVQADDIVINGTLNATAQISSGSGNGGNGQRYPGYCSYNYGTSGGGGGGGGYGAAGKAGNAGQRAGCSGGARGSAGSSYQDSSSNQIVNGSRGGSGGAGRSESCQGTSGGAGGKGGAGIGLYANSISFGSNSKITSNGGNGAKGQDSYYSNACGGYSGWSGGAGGGGGGSGGTILLSANNIVFSGSNPLNAKGGDGGQGGAGDAYYKTCSPCDVPFTCPHCKEGWDGAPAGGAGGPGAGGRIKIFYTTLSGTPSVSVAGGTGGNAGTYYSDYRDVSSMLVSSPFNTQDPTVVWNELKWNETANLSYPSEVKVQLRSAPDLGGTPGTWTDWLGPDGTSNSWFKSSQIAGVCSKQGTEVTCPASVIPPALKDAGIGVGAVQDQWLQYRISLQGYFEALPVFSDISLQYVINTEPQVSNLTASQDAAGLVTVTFSLSDEEIEDKPKPYLFYDVGLTLSSAISSGATLLNLNPSSHFDNLPAAGSLLIDQEIITYSGKGSDSFTGLTRASSNTPSASHPANSKVYLLAEQASFSGATQSCTGQNSSLGNTCLSVTLSPQTKTATWLARNELSGIYLPSFKVRIFINDGNLARQSSLATGSVSPVFVFDVKKPELNFANLPPITLMDTDHTGLDCEGSSGSLATCQKTNANLVRVLLSARDDTALQMNLSTDGSFPSGNWTGYLSNTTISLPGTCAVSTGCLKTTYVKFKDAKGNETSIQSDTITLDTLPPPAPINPIIQDISNPATNDFKLYFSWGVIADPGDFHHYNVERSTPDGTAFVKVMERPDKTDPGEVVGDETLNFYVDSGLNQLQQYYYRASSEDDIGNVSLTTQVVDLNPNLGPSTGGEGEPTGDTTPPAISNIQKGSPTKSGITITWDTDELSNSEVVYSPSPSLSYDKTQGVATNVITGHEVTLIGLIPDTTYNFKVRSTDLSGNSSVGPSDTFTTLPLSTTGPIISNVVVSNKTATGATITWSTNTPATSLVEIISPGPSSLSGSLEMSQAHSVDLTNLTPSTNYQYRVRSTNASGIETIDTTRSFMTLSSPGPGDTTPPVITDIQVTSITARSAAFSWTTDELSSSYVEWGPDTNYGEVYGLELMTLNHSLTLPPVLVPETLVSYQVRSVNEAGLEAIAPGGTFTTGADPSDTTPPQLVSGPTVLDVTPNTATISWSTNEDTDAYVGFSQDISYASEQGSPTLERNHNLLLVGLTAGTQYNFKLKFRDAAGNLTELTNPSWSFATLGLGSDPIAITPDSVTVSDLTSNSALITWSTNHAGDSFVEYGFDQSYGKGTGKFESTTTHSVKLEGLLSETTYSFRVHSQDSQGSEAFSDPLSFTTLTAPDLTPPIISDIKIADVSATSVTITWETNEPTIGKVNYGATASYGQATTPSVSYVASPHSATITNLKAGKQYHYQVWARDEAGNESVSAVDSMFTTESLTQEGGEGFVPISSLDLVPPQITQIQVREVTATGATISWQTNEPSDSMVEYDAQRTYKETAAVLTPVLDHLVTLTSLTPNTTYSFRVSSADEAGNRTRALGGEFTTLEGEAVGEGREELTQEEKQLLELFQPSQEPEGAPEISEIKVDSVTADSVLINWQTNKRASSVVLYGPSTDYSLGSEEVPDLVLDHWVKLADLEPGTMYHFQAKSIDSQGNVGVSTDFSFQTLVLGASNLPPVLTAGPQAEEITSNSALISWITDRPGTSVVSFKPVTLALLDIFKRYTQMGDFERLSIKHEVELTNLTPDTVYRYQVKSEAANGTILKSGEKTFRTKALSDIFDVKVEALTYSTAKVMWRTGSLATTELEYGLSEAYGEKVTKLDFTLRHDVNLTNLKPGTLYYFRVKGFDQGGQPLVSSGFTFKTFEVPVITAKETEQISEETTELRWATNVETDTLVIISDKEGKKQTFGSPQLSKEHSVKISGLEGNRLYQYQIIAKDKLGQESSSELFTFQTGKDTRPPKISQVRTEAALSPKGETIQAIITWFTDEPSTSQVLYNKGLAKLDDPSITPQETPLDTTLTRSHAVIISEFEPGQVYRFKVKSQDKNQNLAQSPDFTILTPKKTGSIIDIIIKNLEEIFGFLRRAR